MGDRGSARRAGCSPTCGRARTASQAFGAYGVVLGAGGELDAAATEARRAALRAGSEAPPASLAVDAEHLRLARLLAAYVASRA